MERCYTKLYLIPLLHYVETFSWLALRSSFFAESTLLIPAQAFQLGSRYCNYLAKRLCGPEGKQSFRRIIQCVGSSNASYPSFLSKNLLTKPFSSSSFSLAKTVFLLQPGLLRISFRSQIAWACCEKAQKPSVLHTRRRPKPNRQPHIIKCNLV